MSAKLFSLGKVVDLKVDEVLLGNKGKTNFVYFPYSGFISLLNTAENHPAMEIALIGREGMLGSTLSTENSIAPLQAIVHASGTALRIEISALQKELLTSLNLRRVVAQYSYLLLVQVSITASCVNFHSVKSRLAKRLLEINDRTDTDSFHSTHQKLADVLGVRRSAISIAAGLLQQQNCISYSRGIITIIDHKALEAASCSCYPKIKY